jgi:MFS family permease
MLGISFIWLSQTDGRYIETILAPMILLGLGVAAFAAPVTTVAMVSAGKGRDGLASGVNNAVARIGPLLAIAAIGYAMAFEFENHVRTNALFGTLPEMAQSFMIAHLNELGGMIFPDDWPVELRDMAQIIIKEAYADTVKFAMKICGAMMGLCILLSLCYHKDDAL